MNILKPTKLIIAAILFLIFSNSLFGQKDSTRLVELDRYWDAYVQAVKEGDFEGLKALYHNDAVLVKAASVI